jgi:hypothetical protein
MAVDITLEQYLKKDPSVIEAKKVFDEAQKALVGSRFATSDVITELQQTRTNAEQSYNKIVAQAKEYFKKNYIGISTSGVADSIAKLEAAKKLAPNQDAIASLQVSIDSLKENLRNPKSYEQSVVEKKKNKPETKKTKDGDVVQEEPSTEVDVDSFTKQVEVAGNKIASMSSSGRRDWLGLGY